MATLLTLFLFVLGLIMIVKGGDWFLDSIIWLGEKTGISYGIIGATLVSIATTLPELFVSTVASDEGFTDMAVGNALGSYICNIGFIVGVCALIKPIKIRDRSFSLKGVLMVFYLFLFYLLSIDGRISFANGRMLLASLLIFIFINFLEYKKDPRRLGQRQKMKISKKDALSNMVAFVFGIGFIILGAHVLVDAGVEIANLLRIPKQVVSLTLLALGTSLPELVTGLSATIKDKQNISVGNILGANILNMTLVMGISSLVSHQGLIISKQTLGLDIPMAATFALIFILPGIIFKKIGRITGLLLLGLYGIYLSILF